MCESRTWWRMLGQTANAKNTDYTWWQQKSTERITFVYLKNVSSICWCDFTRGWQMLRTHTNWSLKLSSFNPTHHVEQNYTKGAELLQQAHESNDPDAIFLNSSAPLSGHPYSDSESESLALNAPGTWRWPSYSESLEFSESYPRCQCSLSWSAPTGKKSDCRNTPCKWQPACDLKRLIATYAYPRSV